MSSEDKIMRDHNPSEMSDEWLHVCRGGTSLVYYRDGSFVIARHRIVALEFMSQQRNMPQSDWREKTRQKTPAKPTSLKARQNKPTDGASAYKTSAGLRKTAALIKGTYIQKVVNRGSLI